MNRIIIIGNGFDMAHGLQTDYLHFLKDVWMEIYKSFLTEGKVSIYGLPDSGKMLIRLSQTHEQRAGSGSVSVAYDMGSQVQSGIYDGYDKLMVTASIRNWVDVENEYYLSLTRLLTVENREKREEAVDRLNLEFSQVAELLCAYLRKISRNMNGCRKLKRVEDILHSDIVSGDIARTRYKDYIDSFDLNVYPLNDRFMEACEEDEVYRFLDTPEDKRRCFVEEMIAKREMREFCRPDRTLVLNFNYTKTAEVLYDFGEDEVSFVNIHGELDSDENPVIFGYGDELDENYRMLEKQQIQGFMENIKSINYLMTDNYRKIVDFLEAGLYQVYVLGHSCGNSDRTLLHTVFEHPNCVSLKIFYHRFANGKDDFKRLMMNVSRNFQDKVKMRDVVVNRRNTEPMSSDEEK